MDCGTTRHSIHSECPYSNVHFWQRICAKLRGQRGVKLNLTVPNRQGKGHMENRKVKVRLRDREVEHAKAG